VSLEGTSGSAVDYPTMTKSPPIHIPPGAEKPSETNKRVMDEIEAELETNLKWKVPWPENGANGTKSD
jgi:hypothetical protein